MTVGPFCTLQLRFINTTEGRAVLHVALRAKQGSSIMCGDKNVVPEVHQVLDRIYEFANKVRSGEHLGASGKKLKNTVSIGIGGSYLGPEFVAEALRTDKASAEHAQGRTLRFLANVDPVDVARALEEFFFFYSIFYILVTSDHINAYTLTIQKLAYANN